MWRKIIAVILICLGIAGMAGTFILWKSGTNNSIKGVSVGNFQIFDFAVSPKPSLDITWSLLITGDVIPARSVNWQMHKKNDFSWPLTKISDVLKNADMTLINLEAPLLTNCPVTQEGMKFCGDARFAQALVGAGVDVANLANNHTLNYGWKGLKETEGHLKRIGIETTGYTYISFVIPAKAGISPFPIDKIPGQAGYDTVECEKDIYCSRLTTKNVQTLKIGFLGYNAVGQRVDRQTAEKQMRAADASVDVLVVSVHWGKEYERYPATDSIAQDDPRELGKLFIEWGADVVVGNHPHWYQPFDFAQGKDGLEKVIFYALGNTVFDQEWSPETKVGYLVKLYFAGKKLLKDKLEIFPLGIRDSGQVYLLEGEAKETVMTFLIPVPESPTN